MIPGIEFIAAVLKIFQIIKTRRQQSVTMQEQDLFVILSFASIMPTILQIICRVATRKKYVLRVSGIDMYKLIRFLNGYR